MKLSSIKQRRSRCSLTILWIMTRLVRWNLMHDEPCIQAFMLVNGRYTWRNRKNQPGAPSLANNQYWFARNKCLIYHHQRLDIHWCGTPVNPFWPLTLPVAFGRGEEFTSVIGMSEDYITDTLAFSFPCCFSYLTRPKVPVINSTAQLGNQPQRQRQRHQREAPTPPRHPTT